MYWAESRTRCGEDGTSSGPSSENPASSKSSQNVSTPASPALRGRITACTTVGGLSSGMRENRRSQRFTMAAAAVARSEEHTSELQSRQYLVCRLLLEKIQADAMSTGRG